MKSFIALLFCLSALSAMADGRFPPIRARDGVLVHPDGREVNLWGVNYQPPLSFEHAARMHNQGVLMPLTAEDLKRAAREGFDELGVLGAEMIRIHLHPADFTDRDGRLVETLWLDVLDYTLAEAQRRGMVLYLTFLNHLNHDGTAAPYDPQSFAARYSREEWMEVPEAVDATERYIRALLNRRNPYTGTRYKDMPALGLVAPINEPEYGWFERWRESHPEGTREEYTAARYVLVKGYLDRMTRVFREEGLEIPVVWNAGWARLIQGRDEVFRAIADSEVDAVAFCLYPGQDDLKPPFWKHPENLSDRNYFPYLRRVSDQWDWLGWLRDERFAHKAKVVYEYETMFNQSAYLYPAMAKLFRSLGVQAAAQWTYAMPVYAEYLGGSHVFNLATTPRKAASFVAAGQLFKTVPRGAPFEPAAEDADQFGSFLMSHPRNLSVGFQAGTLAHSGSFSAGDVEIPSAPERIVGVGASPFASLDSGALYTLERVETHPTGRGWRLTVYPEPAFLLPHWREVHTGEQVVALDREGLHTFRLSHPDITGPRWIYRREGPRWKPEGTLGTESEVQVRAGEYLILPRELRINRKILETDDAD